MAIQRGVTGSNGDALPRYQCIMHIRWTRSSDVKVVGVELSTKRGQEAARVTVGVAGSQQNAAKIALGRDVLPRNVDGWIRLEMRRRDCV